MFMMFLVGAKGLFSGSFAVSLREDRCLVHQSVDMDAKENCHVLAILRCFAALFGIR